MTCAGTPADQDGQSRSAQLHVRRAGTEDLAVVLGVLDGVASWMGEQEIVQWPPRFEPEWVRPDLERGHTWLAELAGEPVATLTLDWADPLWQPDDQAAGYVHRLAVRRAGAGLGPELLGWAAERVRAADRPYLRLDCMADNAKLCGYYEARGFQARGDVSVAGPPGQRYDSGMHTIVRRYEKQV